MEKSYEEKSSRGISRRSLLRGLGATATMLTLGAKSALADSDYVVEVDNDSVRVNSGPRGDGVVTYLGDEVLIFGEDRINEIRGYFPEAEFTPHSSYFFEMLPADSTLTINRANLADVLRGMNGGKDGIVRLSDSGDELNRALYSAIDNVMHVYNQGGGDGDRADPDAPGNNGGGVGGGNI